MPTEFGLGRVFVEELVDDMTVAAHGRNSKICVTGRS